MTTGILAAWNFAAPGIPMSASHGVMPNCTFWLIRSLATTAP